ncbi:hypothetical protein BG011_008327 [Mortierella polycephala]|uniref:F-box domain-containing protein n=1 Tax=Mortierella polycephala TaxID=41804 RepID=A0A9P6PRD0_9FUNG|nr:hypothetical protein BG011_008327 [Mortierella polycephala]
MTQETPGSPEQERQHQLAEARAGKIVDRQRHTPAARWLPHEILTLIFEHLCKCQQTLASAVLVCIDWNLCGTSVLYQNPTFASTFHWAQFVQTMCKSSRSTPLKTRRRLSIIRSLSDSREFSLRPPLQLAPSQIQVYGARLHWKNSRLSSSLGEFVRCVDLSRKPRSDEPAAPIFNSEVAAEVSERSNVSRQSASEATSSRTAGLVLRQFASDANEDIHPDAQVFALHGNDEHTGQETGSDEFDALFSSEFARRMSDELLSNTSQNVKLLKFHYIPDRKLRQELTWLQNRNASVPGTSASGSRSSSHDGNVPTQSPGEAKPLRSLRQFVFSQECQAALGTGHPESQRHTNAGSTCVSTMGAARTGDTPADLRHKKPMTVTVSSLIQMARYCPNLESLCLKWTVLVNDTLNLETGDYQSTLQPGPHAGLTYVDVGPMEGAEALVKHCPKLRKLLLYGCDWVTLDLLRVFVRQYPGLEMLDVRSCSKLDTRVGRLFIVKRKCDGGQENDDSDYKNDDVSNSSVGSANDVQQDTVQQPFEQDLPVATTVGPMFDLVNAACSGRLDAI